MSENGKSFLATRSCIRADRNVPAAPASGEVGEVAKGREAAEQTEAVAGMGAVRPPHPEGRAALSEHAGNVAGICNAIDRRHGGPPDGSAKSGHESRGVVDEGGGNLNSEGLHFAGLQVKHEQCSHE